jgi:hypothetical protein
MSLCDLWSNSRDQLKDKHVQQIIAFAGTGVLSNGSLASKEFRDFLSIIPSSLLARYAEECLRNSFTSSGLALQDVVNQIGRRLDFKVVDGLYRGRKGQIGFDGLWEFPDGHSVVVEVKTTDAYRIRLDTIANYRRSLIDCADIDKDRSSILIVVGREDTGDLEAQIRGSRHAWDVRLISIDALLRLMFLKESLDDPATIRRIYDILVPREFTKLDVIVDIVFSATEEAKHEDSRSNQDIFVETAEEEEEREEKSTPVAFHEACMQRVEEHLGTTVLVRRSRTKYLSADGNLAALCAISKAHIRGEHTSYWFAFHPYQREFLQQAEKQFIVLGCGSPASILLIPFEEFEPWLENFWTTENDDRFYWHIRIHKEGPSLLLDRKGGQSRLNVTKYLLQKVER